MLSFVQEPKLLSELDTAIEETGCRVEYYSQTRRLRVASHGVFRDFYVRDNVLYSGAFGTTPPHNDIEPRSIIETFRFPFLEGHARDEIALCVQSGTAASNDGHSPMPELVALDPRDETTVTLEQSIGPYEIRFVLSLVSPLPFIRSTLFVTGPSWSPAAPQTAVDRNIAFTSMETDPQKAAKLLAPPQDTVDAVPHSIRHGSLLKSLYFDDTDRNDYLIEETPCHLYGYDHPHAGSRFLIRDRESGETFFLLKDGPTLHSTLDRHCDEFFWRDGAACGIRGSGIDPEQLSSTQFHRAYGAILGVGASLNRLLSTYLAVTGPRTGLEPFTISNTWGDRNRDAALDEFFVRSEIDAAAELGIDYVQIDDGWQRGVTKNSGLAAGGVWEGYYAVDEQFWSVHESKFPNGLEPLVEYGRERGVKIGLWFSPDSTGSFSNWRRDADVLLSFYRGLGIDQFKLDGIKIRDKEGEGNLLQLLTAIEHESDGSIDFCMDVTAEIRLGYLYGRRHGKIFVENRYTDWGNYYPYRTLRNLWMLARDMPSRRFQIEVLNNRRNVQAYADDPLAPRGYGMDYLFAIAIPATPLLFMELSHLAQEARAELKPMITLHRSIRDRLSECSIAPIGELPDGHVFSGFQCAHPHGGGYLLLFRDVAPRTEYTFTLAYEIGCDNSLHLMHTAGPWTLDGVSSDRVAVTAVRQRSFAIVEY